jgi:two-component system response regulator (stage 0 sporulation protein A)
MDCSKISVPHPIFQLLCQIGAIATYTGFSYAAYATYLALEQPSRLTRVTKQLYPQVAAQYHTTWQAVERSIRTLIFSIWRADPQRLYMVLGYTAKRRPSPGQFIALMTAYLTRNPG